MNTAEPDPPLTASDLTRPDAGLIVVSHATVGTPDRQDAFIDTAIADRQRTPWPDGLLSLTWLASNDGDTVLTYAQWTTEDAANQDATGIGGDEPIRYKRYRSGVPDRAHARTAGCIVIIQIELDGPDEARQRKWVDTVFEALEAETEPPAGGISAHFHLSTDGTRVLNYAEWTDEDAHRAALARSGTGAIGLSPKWRLVQTFPGMISGGFKRHRLSRTLRRS